MEIGSEAQATCAFCLGTVDVPEGMRQPLADDQALRARLQQARMDLQTAKGSTASGRWALWKNLAWGLFVLGLTVGFNLFILLTVSDDPIGRLRENPAGLVQPLMMTATYAAAIGLIVLNLAFGRLMEFRRAARVPFAVPAGARAQCPSCGAYVTAGKGVTAQCGSCRTEMLLPSYLVSVQLRRRHHDVVMAHQEVGEHQRGQRMAAAASHGCGGLLYVGFALGMLAVPPVLVAASVTGWVPMGVFGALMTSGPPALLMGLAFGWSGLRMLVSGWWMGRAG